MFPCVRAEYSSVTPAANRRADTVYSTMKTKERRFGNEENSEADYYVLGGGRVGAAIVRRLREDGYAATLVDETHGSAEDGFCGNPTDVGLLEEAGLSADSAVVAATSNDGRNLLIAQLVRTHFDVERVVVLVNDPDRSDLVSGAGHETACATTALTAAVVDGLGELQQAPGETA